MLGLYRGPYHNLCRLKIRKCKQYNNKNANIEYYTDEKGNIRKRKIK